jgi:hypothetical protein
MTIQRLIDKYLMLHKQGYETITIFRVISDLKHCQKTPQKKMKDRKGA